MNVQLVRAHGDGAGIDVVDRNSPELLHPAVVDYLRGGRAARARNEVVDRLRAVNPSEA